MSSQIQGLFMTMRLWDVLDILVVAFFLYRIYILIRDTRATALLKGLIFLGLFTVLAGWLQLHVVSWILDKLMTVLIVALPVVFQPELRRALDQLGRKNIIFSIFGTSAVIAEEDRRSRDKINSEIVKAVFEMSKVKTGALIVMEKKVILNEYERTGIPIDALISSQLLMNIFEHNTPLHDGAVFIRNQRVVAATCYLPLSDNMELSKELGTRHRAGVGISEVSDSLTIIVSEETGAVSIAESGKLTRSVSQDDLKAKLAEITQSVDDGKRKKLRERIKNERKTDV